MKRKRLYFSLGPVQGFVAQARRTRDFWAGSFILSYLAGKAMLAVINGINSEREMIIPKVEEDGEIINPFLKALQENGSAGGVSEDALVSTLPNRFTAVVPGDFDPKRCIKEVRESWEKMADAVWKAYVAPVADKGKGTRDIWDRQVKNFWEITWVVGEAADEKKLSPLLDYRKNWRSWVLSAEPGDKCTLMGGLQEVSGWIRSKDRDKQDGFWEALRRKVGGNEIDDGERLSAIALIKRLFPLVSQEAIGWSVQQESQDRKSVV